MLPTVQQKFYRTKLASSGKEVKIRPFMVGEQKQLMLVKTNGKKDSDIYKAVLDLMKNCSEGISVDELYTIDFEKLFYDLRSISDGDIVKFTLKYNKDPDEKKLLELQKEKKSLERKMAKGEYEGIDDDAIRIDYLTKEIEKISAGEECEADHELDMQKDLIISNKNFEKEIVMDDKTVLKFSQPKIKDLIRIEEAEYTSEEEKTLDIIAFCLKEVAVKDEVFKPDSHKEAVEYIDKLPAGVLKSLIDFYQNQPTLVCTKEFKCEGKSAPVKLSAEAVRGFLS